MATVALSGIITPSNVVTATSTSTLTNKTLTAPTIASANLTTALTLAGAAGTNGQVLTSAGSGLPSWTTISSSPTLVRSTRTSNTVLGTADVSTLIDITSGTFSQTFTAAATLGSGWFCYIRNSGTGDITLDPNGSETIDGLTSFIVYPGESRLVQCTGTAFFSLVLEFGYREFTSTGTFIAPPGVSGYIIDAFGGGGGGSRGNTGDGRSGPGGGGGAHNQMSIDPITAGTSITVTVGAGGAAGTNGVGGIGGTTSFGNYVYAYGGGSVAAQGAPGGGTASAGDAAGAKNEYVGGGGWPNLRLSTDEGGQIQVDVQIYSQISGGGAQARGGDGGTGYSAEWGGGSGAPYITAATGGAGGSSLWGGGGGGAGGGTGSAGGAGGATGVWQTGGGGAGGANGVNGTNGAAGTANRGGAGGGGGGAGANGGTGGFPSGGGGGGGRGNAGLGGAGGAGKVFIKMI